MQQKTYSEDPAELLTIFAPRFSRVKLVAHRWDNQQSGGNLCYLRIVRDGVPIQIDTTLPHFDIRKLDIDLQSTGEIAANESMLQFLTRRITTRVNEVLDAFEFKIVLDCADPVRFSLGLAGKAFPDGLFIPWVCEGSWRSFLPDGTPEQKAYLAAYRLRLEREKDGPKVASVLAELQGHLGCLAADSAAA